MSRIFKSSNVIIDENSRVTIKTNKIKSNLINKEKYCLDKYDEDKKVEKYRDKTILKINKIKEETKLEIIEMKKKAKIEVNKIKEEAKLEAYKIKEDLKKKAEEEYEDIKERAYNEGYKKGINLATEEAEKIKKEAILYSENLKNSLEEEIVTLISDIIKKILFNEVEINPNIISILLKNVLYKNNIIGNIKLKVSKEDYEEVEKVKNSILSDLNNISDLEIIVDDNFKKSDCIIETSLGIIDCGLSTQYRELKRGLYNILKIGD